MRLTLRCGKTLRRTMRSAPPIRTEQSPASTLTRRSAADSRRWTSENSRMRAQLAGQEPRMGVDPGFPLPRGESWKLLRQKRRGRHAAARTLDNEDFPDPRHGTRFEVEQRSRCRHAAPTQRVRHFPGAPRRRPAEPRQEVAPAQRARRFPDFAAQGPSGRPQVHDGGANGIRPPQPQANAVGAKKHIGIGTQLEHLVRAEDCQAPTANAGRVGHDQPTIGTLPLLVVADLFAAKRIAAKRFNLPGQSPARAMLRTGNGGGRVTRGRCSGIRVVFTEIGVQKPPAVGTTGRLKEVKEAKQIPARACRAAKDHAPVAPRPHALQIDEFQSNRPWDAQASGRVVRHLDQKIGRMQIAMYETRPMQPPA